MCIRDSIHARKRFLEVIRVDDFQGAVELVNGLNDHPAHRGIDGIQTVGIAVENGYHELVNALSVLGVYRIVPLHDMYMRGAIEPYDGKELASHFTYSVYRRDPGGD